MSDIKEPAKIQIKAGRDLTKSLNTTGSLDRSVTDIPPCPPDPAPSANTSKE